MLDQGGFLLRASIYHFSQGCLGRRISMESPGYTEKLPGGWPRRSRREIEFVNVTDKSVAFLVLPTSWSVSVISKIALKVSAASAAELGADVGRNIDRAITELGLSPQMIELPPRIASGQLAAREVCPHERCPFPEWTGQTVRVALITLETQGRRRPFFWPFSGEMQTQTLKIWRYWDVAIGTRYAVLPRQFDAVMNPLLGAHPHLKDDPILQTALRALVRNEMAALSNAPVAGLHS